jgi:hypothetical protein
MLFINVGKSKTEFSIASFFVAVIITSGSE